MECDCSSIRFSSVVLVVDRLRERHVEHRPRRLPQREARELHVPHHADDTKGAGVLGQIHAEVLPERILTVLEEALDERLVDDGDGFRRVVVGCGERASAQHRRAEVLQIVRADAIP